MDNPTSHETGTKWRKLRAGFYMRVHGGHRFTAEYNPETKLWECRRDQILFDAGRTLAEAKSYCNEPDKTGKPLIDVL